MENILEELKEIGVKLEKKIFKLEDKDLETINGGFEETNSKLPTYGLEVKCPKCGQTSAEGFEDGVGFDTTQNTVEYHCKCGCEFIVKDGYAVIKSNWINLCNKKGYTYKA
ncbi:MAG: hypothetical protein J5829_09970 [Lachnospiraceae bacterium]|nr:hypothetical protein [Lachnospiraceae bacterium]